MSSLDMELDPDQIEAWTRAAGDKPLAQWLTEVADAAALAHELVGEDPKTLEVWPREVKLAYPIKVSDGEVITRLMVRRGVAADIRGLRLPAKADDISADLILRIASRLAGCESHIIDKLDGEDAGEVNAIAVGFLGRCLGGRSKSRPR
jgi:hypothetical protein